MYTYPLKSAGGILLSETSVSALGFEYDREFALVNSENQVLTAREKPELLRLQVSIEKDSLVFSYEKKHLEVSLNANNQRVYELELFKKPAFGICISAEADAWFSRYLNEPIQLVRIANNKLRTVSSKYQLKGEHNISFADGFPIHLVSEASVAELNTRLDTQISPERFRPNLIITGVEAYSEETWKSISIGNLVFDVITPTPRCSLITVDPKTAIPDAYQEPLRTLSKYRRVKNQTNFGVYLIARNPGMISITDALTVN